MTEGRTVVYGLCRRCDGKGEVTQGTATTVLVVCPECLGHRVVTEVTVAGIRHD